MTERDKRILGEFTPYEVFKNSSNKSQVRLRSTKDKKKEAVGPPFL